MVQPRVRGRQAPCSFRRLCDRQTQQPCDPLRPYAPSRSIPACTSHMVSLVPSRSCERHGHRRSLRFLPDHPTLHPNPGMRMHGGPGSRAEHSAAAADRPLRRRRAPWSASTPPWTCATATGAWSGTSPRGAWRPCTPSRRASSSSAAAGSAASTPSATTCVAPADRRMQDR